MITNEGDEASSDKTQNKLNQAQENIFCRIFRSDECQSFTKYNLHNYETRATRIANK